MITIQLNEQTAKAVQDYGYEPNELHQLKLKNCLQLMDFTVCMHEITGGGPPYWFDPNLDGDRVGVGGVEGTTICEGQQHVTIDLSAFHPK